MVMPLVLLLAAPLLVQSQKPNGAVPQADASYCFAYITGVHDTVRAYEAWLNQREFCVPRHVPQGDLRQAFIDYLRDKPSDLSGEAASVVVVALKIRYACGSGARGTPPAPSRSGKP